jgi:CRP-like cAMP-binding protein
MNSAPSAAPGLQTISKRLQRLSLLKDAEIAALEAAEHEVRWWPVRREIVAEGARMREQRAVMSGWACRQHVLLDGRRQILCFLLPGDLIGIGGLGASDSFWSIVAITAVATCRVPIAEAGSSLAEAYALSDALEQHHLLAHIIRLGQMDARERLADWLLETRDRLALVGLATVDRIPFPLTQEMLADALGITSVHVNRTLSAMRRDGLVEKSDGSIVLLDPHRLQQLVDYKPAWRARASSTDS